MVEKEDMFEGPKRKANSIIGLLPAHLLGIVLFCCILSSSCQRENISSNRLVISAEGIGNSQSKMYVDDKVSYWEDGDEMIINGGRVAIRMDGSGNSYADLDSYNPENNYWGVTTDYFLYNIGNNLTFNLPHLYQYRTITVDVNTYQKLEAPMVGYKTSSDEKLVLKHLTGVLMVNVQNHANGSSPIVIDRITVSNNQGYKLCGSLTINYTTANGDGFSVSPQTGASGVENSVIMDFGNGLSIDYGDNQTVQIPIRVAGSNGTPVKFNVKVEGHINNTRYTFEQEQTTGGVLGRAVAGYASVDINPSGGYTSTGPLFSSIVGGDDRTYYQLYTPSDWCLMTQNAGYSNNYILMDDLNMEGITTYTIPGAYAGIISGNFHTITNLTVLSSVGSEPQYMNGGLIEFGNGATISALSINGMTIKRREGSTAQIPFGGAIASFVSGSFSIENVHINNLKIDFGDVTTTSLIWGGFIGDIQSNDVSIVSSSVTFAADEVLSCSDIARIGGIASGRYSSSYMHCTPTLDNVSVNFNSLTINQTSNAVTYFGGLLGNKGYANVTPTNCSVGGNVQINSNGTVYKGKVYGDSSEIPDGINVSGLNWN